MLFRVVVFFSILSLAAGLPVHPLLAFPLEINASFPYLYFVFDLIALVYFVRKRSNVWLALCLVAILIQSVSLFWPLSNRSQLRFEGGTEFSILYSNVFVNNNNTKKLRELISKENPDLVLLTEVSDPWLKQLDIGKDYPFSFLRPGKSADGNAIYSKFPLTETRRIPEKNYFAALSAKVELNSKKDVYVNLVHAPAPQLDFDGDARLDFFKALAAEIKVENRHNTFVIGDFNISSSNRLLGRILAVLQMRLSSNGWFDFPTWRPLEVPILLSPIDHLALGEEIESLTFRAGPDIGSDHFPLLAKLRIR